MYMIHNLSIVLITQNLPPLSTCIIRRKLYLLKYYTCIYCIILYKLAWYWSFFSVTGGNSAVTSNNIMNLIAAFSNVKVSVTSTD